MNFETAWYSVSLPAGYAGEMKAGVLHIRCDSAPGSLEVECICKSSGTTKDLDLQDHAGQEARPCACGRLHGYRFQGPELERWALSEPRSNKLLLVRLRKANPGEPAGPLAEAVIQNIKLK